MTNQAINPVDVKCTTGTMLVNTTKTKNIEILFTREYDMFYRLNSNRIGTVEEALNAIKLGGELASEGKRFITRLKRIIKSMGNHTLRISGDTVSVVPCKDYDENTNFGIGFDALQFVRVANIRNKGKLTYVIFDGNTRTEAARLLGIEFAYVVDDTFLNLEDVEEYMLKINNSQTPWLEREKVRCYVSIKGQSNPIIKQNMQLIKDFAKEFKVSEPQAHRVIFTNGSISKHIERGTFGTLTPIKNLDKLVTILRALKNGNVKFYNHNYFLNAITSVVSNNGFTDENMLKLSNNINLYKPMTKTSEYKQMLITNFALTLERNVRLKK